MSVNFSLVNLDLLHPVITLSALQAVFFPFGGILLFSRIEDELQLLLAALSTTVLLIFVLHLTEFLLVFCLYKPIIH